MNIQRFLSLPIVTAIFLLHGCGDSSRAPVSKFKPSEVWKYHTRAGEEASRITILKIEGDPKYGTIVHFRLSGINVHGLQTIPFVPYFENALANSVTEMESSGGPIPVFDADYNNWKPGFDSGSQNFWPGRKPIADWLNAMDAGIAKQLEKADGKAQGKPEDKAQGKPDDKTQSKPEDIPAGKTQEKPPEKAALDVVLIKFDDTKKIATIKVVREITGLGLKDAKDLVEQAPKVVKAGVAREEAEAMKAKLEKEGATVELK